MSRHRGEAPTSDLHALLQLPTWRAFDVDDEGRVLAGHDTTGTVQLVEIAPDGTATLLTELEHSCTGRYARGARAVVVEHDNNGDELTQLSLLRLDPFPADVATLDDLEPLVRQPAYVHRLLDVAPGRVVFAANDRNGIDFDVRVLDLGTGVQTALYEGGGMVAEARLSPTGREVAVAVLSARPCSTQVRVGVGGGQFVEVTDSDDHASHGDLSWLPDGTGLVMSSNHERDHRAVARVLPDGDWRWLCESDRHDVSVWPSPDGVAMLIGHSVDGGTRLAVHDTHGRRVRNVPLPADGVVTARWSPDSSKVVLGLAAPAVPGDVLMLDVTTGDLELLATSAAEDTDGLIGRLVEPTSHRVPTPDGERVPCFVYRPRAGTSAAVADLEGAVVIHLHGGPEAQAQRVFDPVVQAMVAAGVTVVVPNVRGSTGYGKRWYSLDDGRRRLDAIADLLAVRDWLPEVDGDPDRVALYGASYGGYLVLAGLSMQSWAWRAGVDIVGMSSLVTFLENTAPYRRAVREREYGSLERDRPFLEAASPITYLEHVAAPLFVIHGANDPRVPLSESQQIKAALDAREVPCELMVFDDEGHGLSKRKNRLEAYPRAVDFLLHHLSLKS